MTAPLASILIPTFNRAHYVGDAIASALSQTVRDIEVVVVDDGSTDDTTALLSTVTDPRLRVIRHERNAGIPATRNTALAAATGRYIAWLDSDDVARPTRLAEQIAFLDAHPDIAMVGAAAGKMTPDGHHKRGMRIPPLDPPTIAAWLLFRSAFQQSAVTGRAEVLTRYRYADDCPVCEDVDMFLRLQQDHRLANLPRVLVDRRIHPEQTVRQQRERILERKAALVRPALERLGVEFDADDLRRHAMLGQASMAGLTVNRDFLDWTRSWLRRLADANGRSQRLDPRAFALASDYVWVQACRAMAPRIGMAAALRAALARPPLTLVGPKTAAWIGHAVAARWRG